jgi:hypothetical protein
VKELVLGCVQSWLNRFGREDIIKMVSDNFIDTEIFNGLKCLYECLQLEPPKKRFNTKKQTAVKVWAAELYDTMIKDDYVEKLPEFVVSSQELQRVPLALLSGANDVVPVCTRMNMMEKKMEEMVDTMTKFTKGQILSAMSAPGQTGIMPSGSYANALALGAAPPGTPRLRVPSFGNAAVKRKFDESIGVLGPAGQHGAVGLPGQPGQGVQGVVPPPVQGQDRVPAGPTPEGQAAHGQQVKDGDWIKPKTQRKQFYGTSKVVATGSVDWAAPVEVFVSNTSPDITEEEIKSVLKLCADEAVKEGNTELGDFAVKGVKCLTKAEIENPRTKCWRVSVPFKFKEYIMSDLAYPMGWCHRPFYPPRSKSKQETEAEQQAKRNRIGNAMQGV